MGIGKLGKRLIKVGRQTGKDLGKRGKEMAEAVFEKAISILETELKGAAHAKPAATRDRKNAPAEGKPPRRPAAQETDRPPAPEATAGHAAGRGSRQQGPKPAPKPAKKAAKRQRSVAAERRAAVVDRKASATPASDGGNPPNR
jgi:hypothetical protein